MTGGIFYEEQYAGLFLLVTVAMGGGAAWLSGRAIGTPSRRAPRRPTSCSKGCAR